MDINAVKTSYKYWAPIYDSTFGAITKVGRRKAVEYLNGRSGSVLEIGVGTGLALDYYDDHLEVTGIDVSPEMLAKARQKVDRQGLSQIVELREMDARVLDYPDDHFDTVVAMYLVSVVPEPEKVIAEMARVCKPGGEVLIINHFARESGALAAIENAFAPFANLLGWHSDFPMDRVQGVRQLETEEIRTFPPFGMFTFLKQRKCA
ncbi:MAG: class I SAM-dependent methyltransferase [Paracoccaceae bacterium]